MLSFCIRKSNTVLSWVLFLGTHTMGTACCAVAGTHHPTLVYQLTLSASSAFKASGHLGKQYIIHLPGSMRLIWWLISWSGGSLAGIPPIKSEIFRSHCSLKPESLEDALASSYFVAIATFNACWHESTGMPTCFLVMTLGELLGRASPERLHSGGLCGPLMATAIAFGSASVDSDGWFLGTRAVPIRMWPGPLKSKMTPKRLRNGVPNITS